ncbi:MAG: WbqC family protein [Candidatus Marinimicrobia bacterium]|nr:WbqC family protein [Candidatus Neomarinimicrobiota bacterium]
MICAIHQPQTYPWLGYFAKIMQSDIFVFFDDVQFKKNEYQNRNRIKTDRGWMWLTVPVVHNFGQKINEVQIDNKQKWKKKHLNTLITYYRKAPFFNSLFAELKELYSRKYELLIDFNIATIEWILKKLKIEKKILLSSSLNYNPDQLPLSADEKLINILKIINTETYLSGQGGKNYLNLELFKDNGIKVIFQDFRHPVYHQLYGDFIPNLSILDLLFNEGENSINIITKGIK